MCCTQLKDSLDIQDKDECFSDSTVAKEKGKEFRIIKNANQQLCKVRIDGCLITDITIKKCDFMFYVCETQKLLLVELKGKNIEHAISQITHTKGYLKQKLCNPDSNYEGIIVSSSVPRSAERRFRNIQEKTYKQHKIIVRKKHLKYVEKIN